MIERQVQPGAGQIRLVQAPLGADTHPQSQWIAGGVEDVGAWRGSRHRLCKAEHITSVQTETQGADAAVERVMGLDVEAIDLGGTQIREPGIDDRRR